jgi:hypothetical protein
LCTFGTDDVHARRLLRDPRAPHLQAMHTIDFPTAQRPERSPVYTRNELLLTGVTAEQVWKKLVDARRWPSWYGNARDVVLDGGARELEPGTRFHWTTFGVRVHTAITEHVPLRRLAWTGRGLGSTAYHGWAIEPRAEGVLVITEETQQGLIPWLARWFLRRGLLKWHQRWLEGLRG